MLEISSNIYRKLGIIVGEITVLNEPLLTIKIKNEPN